MLTWNQLTTYSYSNPPRIILGRSSDVEEKYKKHKLIHKNITNYLNNKYFSDDSVKLVFDKNMFPYLCEEGIEHNVLWIHKSIELNDDFIQNLEGIICRQYFKDLEDMNNNCVYFRNIEQLQSVKAIPHIHIFIRR